MSDQRLLRFLAVNALIGIVVGWVLLAALILLDVARLGQLLWASEDRVTTIILAAAGFGVTFGSLAMGTAIFLLPKR